MASTFLSFPISCHKTSLSEETLLKQGETGGEHLECGLKQDFTWFLSLDHNSTETGRKNPPYLDMIWDEHNSMIFINKKRLFYGKSQSVEVLQIQAQSDLPDPPVSLTFQRKCPPISPLWTEQRLKLS